MGWPSLRLQLFLGLLGSCGLLGLWFHDRPTRLLASRDVEQKWELMDQTGWHRAVLNTIIREGEGLDSKLLRTLRMGAFVHVLERRGRRVRIDFPAKGWTSSRSASGQPILMWDEPEAQHQNVWSLPRGQRAAVFDCREVLRRNQKKEKQAQKDEQLEQGV